MTTRSFRVAVSRRLSAFQRRGKLFRSVIVLLLVLACVPAFQSQSMAAKPAVELSTLLLSFSPNRTRPVPLADEIVSNNIFVFITPAKPVTQVRFFLDHPDNLLEEPAVAGTPRHVAQQAPYDFEGTGSNARLAKAFDTKQLANGLHTITAAMDLASGGTEVVNASFVVHNGRPAVLSNKQLLKFTIPRGRRSSEIIELFTSNHASGAFTLQTNAPWINVERDDGTYTVKVDAINLAPGTYTTTLTASAPSYDSASIPVTMDVAAAGTCSPLPCSDILIEPPYELSFSQNHGKILDSRGAGTGMTYVDHPASGNGYIPANLTVNTASPGTLQIKTTKGLAFKSANAQDNALAVGIDAPSFVSIVQTTLRNPSAGTGQFEQAGLWFGNNQDNYVKLDVISTSTGTQIEYLKEENGAVIGKFASSMFNPTNATVALRLRANPADQTIKAFYRINSGSLITLGDFVVSPEMFSFDAAGIDPTIGTRSFGGIYASHRNAVNPLTYSFDQFSVTTEAAPSGSTTTTFDRTSATVPSPTALAWGPDGRLYVTEVYGKIHALTFNDAKQVVDDQVITTLGSRLTLGIAVDPQSTASNVVLWVSHSNPSTSSGQLNSSTVSKLSGSGFATKVDVITGLPRAIANHAINALHFGPDGRLYMAIGGNTGAGAPNTAATEFGTRAEQPLSAALIVADVRATSFDGTCATPENTFGPAPCNVQIYASGLRNAYDFAWHSNGTAYATDNGLGVTGSYPPKSSPPCTGNGNTTPWTQGGNNPGTQPDLLLRIEQGKYYGHPNPYRNECVFKDGSYQGVAPLANFVAPIYSLGDHRSANGIIEYRSDAFNGTLKGELLVVNYSSGDDITRIKLSADGRSVVEAKQLVGNFNDPLALVQGPDGTIYVGEYGGSKVTALKPRGTTSTAGGTWSTKQAMPTAVLDAGSAVLNGKLYSVAGKTSTAYLRSMSIYDPATNAWTSGPSLPSTYPAVENPAMTAVNGKLYVFGGSTAPFSGAVTNAAVFEPTTSSWTALAPLRVGRGGATAQAIGSKIYLVGGMDSSGASLASVEVYDVASNTWSGAAAMSTRRDNPGSAVLGGNLFVFGGRTRNADGSSVSDTLASTEMYDPGTNSWVAKAAMPTGRRTMAVGTLNGRAQVMGGERTSTGGTFAQNEEYDPITNTWRALTPMITPRHGAVVGTINGVVYVAGGGPTGGSSFTTVHEAFTAP